MGQAAEYGDALDGALRHIDTLSRENDRLRRLLRECQPRRVIDGDLASRIDAELNAAPPAASSPE